MPHVRTLFPDNGRIRNLIRDNKTLIRMIVSGCTGYRLEEIALIPDIIPHDHADLSENLLPLEFVIDTGTKCSGKTKEVGNLILNDLMVRVPGLCDVNFGVWLRSMTDNHFAEHKPPIAVFDDEGPGVHLSGSGL